VQLQFSQHQCTPVSNTDKVCSGRRYRNIDPLGRRHECTRSFPHEVSATDTWCMLVGSRLQCRGASVIWFVNHWLWSTYGQLTSSTLISGHVVRLDHGVPEHMLCVRWWIGTKAESQWLSWRRPPGRPHNIWHNKIRCTAIYAMEIWDCGGSQSGAIVHSGYATTTTMMMKDERFVSKMEGKTYFFDASTGCLEPGLLSVRKSLT